MTREDNKLLAYELRDHQGFTWESIGGQLGVSRKTAKRLYEEYILGDIGSIKVVVPPISSPILSIDRFKPLHIYGDAMVTCDWHVPLHSTSLVNKLFEKAQQEEIKKLIIVGDFWNMDGFSHFQPRQPEARFELEKEEGTALMDAALDVFDEIILSLGNHDYRIVKFLEHKLSFEFCMKWVLESLGEEKLNRIKFTDLDYLVYHPGHYDIRLCHQQNFSTTPLAVARKLESKYNMSIFATHSHHFAQGVAYSGTNLLFEGGGLFDPNMTEYIQRTNAHHVWTQGFYMFKNGIAHPYSPLYHNI